MSVTKDDVEDAVEFYKHVLGLDRWRINLSYIMIEDGTAYAHISPAYEYMRADLNVNLELFDSQDRMRRTIIHELCHCVLSPVCDVIQHHITDDNLRKTFTSQQELVVTHLEQLPIWEHIIPPKRKNRKRARK